MRFWVKRRENLIHDYSLVGYILSPHPTIMADAAKNMTQDHLDAAQRLITKLLVDPSLTGHQERLEAIAKTYDIFLEEFEDFKNKKGRLNSDIIWVMAALDDTKAYAWHKKYTLFCTKVLGKLACLVTSKIFGIGTAKRNWKQVKQVKSGQRVKIGMDKTKKQVLIHAIHGEHQAEARRSKLSAAGNLWSDKDFESMKMDLFCKEIKDSLNDKQIHQSGDRVLHLWNESWEKTKVNPQQGSNYMLDARLTKKYCGLKYYDVAAFGMDTEFVMTVHPSKIKFVPKQKGNSKFMLYATCQDPSDEDVTSGSKNWQTVDIDDDLFDGLHKYYSEHGSVKCYEKGGECLSDYAGED